MPLRSTNDKISTNGNVHDPIGRLLFHYCLCPVFQDADICCPRGSASRLASCAVSEGWSPGSCGIIEKKESLKKQIMSLMKIICIALCLHCLCTPLQAQKTLEPVEDTAALITGILGGGKKGVSAVRLISDAEQSVAIEADYKGFEGKYQVKGFILNSMKKPVEEIVCQSQTLSRADGTVELEFLFKDGSGNYTNTTLDTHFLSIVFSKTDGLLSGIDLGDQNVLGETYLYKLNKSWRVGGSESMVITVKLTPFKSAASIQP